MIIDLSDFSYDVIFQIPATKIYINALLLIQVRILFIMRKNFEEMKISGLDCKSNRSWRFEIIIDIFVIMFIKSIALIKIAITDNDTFIPENMVACGNFPETVSFSRLIDCKLESFRCGMFFNVRWIYASMYGCNIYYAHQIFVLAYNCNRSWQKKSLEDSK